MTQVQVEVQYDRTSQLELATRSSDLSAQLSGARITDQQSLDVANAVIVAGVEWLKAVDRIMDPVREATHKAWKAAIAAQDEFKAPVEKPLKALKAAASQFIAEAQAEAQRKQHEAEEAQRKINEAQAREVAARLRSSGVAKAEIREVKQEILATPAPIVQPKVEAAAGMSVRTLYSAEITNLDAFLRHLVTDSYLLTLFSYSAAFKKAIESELRGEASKRKEDYSIPGTKLVKSASGAWRG